METHFEILVNGLYERANAIIKNFIADKRRDDTSVLHIPNDFKEEFLRLVDAVNANLMEDKDNFYGYFLFQMTREIRFDISSPTAVNFKGANYCIYFNPLVFLGLTKKQMESSIKHEILHIVSLHLIRAKEAKAGNKYSTLAMNMAMDIVVNTYLDHLPPYAVTLEWANIYFSLQLLPFESFEYYAQKIQTAIDLLDTDETEDDSAAEEQVEPAYNVAKTHDVWQESSAIDEKTLQEFTEKVITNAQKGSIPGYLASMIAVLKKSNGDLPWNLYLKRLLGTVESSKKKTVTRRNRRQPDRLDLRGQLRSHKAKIVVALDISGSISDEEFNQAISEVLHIVKTYGHEITIIECDSEIRRAYTVKAAKDVKERVNTRAGTNFTPVFEYANRHNVDLLVYFTDGLGEDKLLTAPKGYKTLWVLSGGATALSLKEAYGPVKRLQAVETKVAVPDKSDGSFREGYSMNNQEKMHI